MWVVSMQLVQNGCNLHNINGVKNGAFDYFEKHNWTVEIIQISHKLIHF